MFLSASEAFDLGKGNPARSMLHSMMREIMHAILNEKTFTYMTVGDLNFSHPAWMPSFFYAIETLRSLGYWVTVDEAKSRVEVTWGHEQFVSDAPLRFDTPEPKTIEQAMERLDVAMPAKARNEFRSCAEVETARYMHSLGHWLRESWELDQAGPLIDYFNSLGITRADDMAYMLLRAYWRHAHHQPLNAIELAARLRMYWEEREK